jgi:hypothetical protein
MKRISHFSVHVLLIFAILFSSCSQKKANLIFNPRQVQAPMLVRSTFTSIPTMQVTKPEIPFYTGTYVMICGMYIPF